MKLDGIKEGQSFKNYKELCNAIDEKVKGGDSKKYQLIDWERYFKYKKEGYKFIIEEIYDKTLDKTVKSRSNNHLPFLDELELLLLDMLIRERDQLIMSRSKLMIELCLVNPNYYRYFAERMELAQLLDTDIDYIIDFYDTTSETFKGALETVTKRLENKKLVIHERIYMLQYDNENKEVIEYCNIMNGYTTVKKKVFREATKEERETILDIERGILQYKYGANNIQELFKSGKIHFYYQDVKQAMKNRLGVDRAYKAERYTYNVEHVINQKVRLLKEYDIKHLEYSLNNKVIERINDNSIKRYERAVEELLVSDGLMKRTFRTNDDYVDSINYVASGLVQKDNEDSIKHNDKSIEEIENILEFEN